MTVCHAFIPLMIALGAWTNDRFVHFLWASVFFVCTLVILSGIKALTSNKSDINKYWERATHPEGISRSHAIAMAFFVLFLGSWVPDLDWKFGVHRSPLTHSVLPFIGMMVVVKKAQFGNKQWNQLLLPLFGIALGSHLIVDFFQGGNLVSIPAHYEFIFYSVNGLSLCVFSYFQMRKVCKRRKYPS